MSKPVAARRRLTRTLALGALLALALGGAAEARWDVFRAGNVVLKFDGGALPKALPRHEAVPVGVLGKFQIATTDGSHAPSFRGGTFDVDRNVELDAEGLPVCHVAELEARNSNGARRVCGDSIVGSGKSTVEVAFPEQAPIFVESPLTFFNGGVRNGITTLYVHIFITVPVPAAIVTTTTFRRIDDGRYGLRAVSRVPVIAGGSGSVVAGSFKLNRLFEYRGERRSYLTAKCPDGRLMFKIVDTVIKDEVAGLTAPSLSGSLARPCTPKG